MNDSQHGMWKCGLAQVDPCHLYDKPAVDCILSDWEEWGECDVSPGALLRCGFNLLFFSYVSMFNLFKLQLTPSSVRCGAGQQVKRRQVVQCSSNGPTEAETAWKSHLTVFGFHHLLCMWKSLPRRYPSKGGYGCTSALWEPRVASLVTSTDKRHKKCDEQIFMTTALRSLTRACNIQAGQQDSMFPLHACQNDKWSECPPAPWSR